MTNVKKQQSHKGYSLPRLSNTGLTSRNGFRIGTASALRRLILIMLVVAGSFAGWFRLAYAQTAIQLPTIEANPSSRLPNKAGTSTFSGPANQSNPTSITTISQQSSRLLAESQPKLALEMLDKGLETSPRDPQLRFLKGVALTDLKQTEPAITLFTALSQDFPELPEPYNNLAVLHANNGDLDRARVSLEAAVRALPTYAIAHENLGDLYLRLAARQYETAGKANPKNNTAGRKLSLARDWVNQVIKINVQ
jgi:tetratricopeptide (TPR) repeat protein